MRFSWMFSGYYSQYYPIFLGQVSQKYQKFTDTYPEIPLRFVVSEFDKNENDVVPVLKI